MATSRTPKKEEKLLENKIQDRFKNLFSGQEEPPTHMSNRQVEALQARVVELETQLTKRPEELRSPDLLRQPIRKSSPAQKPPSAKKRGVHPNVFIKSIAIITVVFVVAAIMQYRFSLNLTKQEIEQASHEHSEANYESYVSRIKVEQNTAEALAESIAQRPDVKELYLAGDRQALYDLLAPTFNELKEKNRIVHLYIEDPTGTVFLRVHKPEQFGDDITYRGTASDALSERRTTSGIEIGANRIGVRGVTPMYSGNQLIGLVEIGLDFDEQFVKDLQALSGSNYSMWVTYEAAAPAGMKPNADAFVSPLEDMFYYTGTITKPWNISPEVYREVLATGQPTFEVITQNAASPSIVYIAPLYGYKNKIIGIFEIADSYQGTLDALQRTRTNILEVVAGITLLGLALIAFFYRRLVLRPLAALAEFANQQLSGDTGQRVFIGSNDEFEQLAATFNNLADAVEERQWNLEERVRERTYDLERASEVGRLVAEKVTNVQNMLNEATEIIRARFNLYYTQVYLADPTGKTLTLKSGTGEVGQQLLARGHHLLIQSSSINGRAASEKKAMVVSDTTQSPNFLPNPLLPKTRSEMVVPLLIGDRLVGVLDMQSETPGALNETNLTAFETLAGQLSIAIQNASLLAQSEESRKQLEMNASRAVQKGWDDFMNGIDRGERIGFGYDQDKTVKLTEVVNTDPSTLNIPIKLVDAPIGTIQVKEEGRTWTSHEIEFLQSTSNKLAQHLENIRLLTQAEQYRSEAEMVAHRLTQQGWNSYQQTHFNETSGYVFDLTEVQPILPSSNGHVSEAVKHPLMVQGQVIGELTVAGAESKHETTEIVAAIAEQLSSHIESLRLFEQTQSALAITREREAQLSEALNIAKLAYWEYDFDNDLFTFDDHFYSIFRTTAAEVGGYKLSSAQYAQLFVHPEDAALVGNEIGKTIASTERHFSANLEHRVIFPNGEMGYMSVEVHVERDENGKITRWYGANQDITERKKAEEVILLAQQRAQAILESVTVPMVITRLADNIMTFINKPAVDMVQVNYEEAINKPSPNFYYNPEHRSKFIAELRAKGYVSDMAVQLLRFNQEPFWALISARVFEYQGEPSILSTFMDVTERIHAQEAMAKHAAELQTVAEVSTTTATTLEPQRLLQSVIDLTKERFGLYHAHIYLLDENESALRLAAGAGNVGRQLVTEGHSISMDTHKSLVVRAARERQTVIVNDVRSDPNFLPNPLLPETSAEMAVPMIVGDLVLGVFDVQSASNGFSQEDASIYTTLASQVAVALQNARLYVEQSATVAQLRELDRLKSSFLANMSHELRTPLNSILGFADVMLEELDGPLTDYMNNDLHLIQKNGQHLLHLINDVLDMAKIEAGRMNLSPEKFRVHDVLDEVTSITSTLASEKNLALLIDETSDQDVEIYADHTRLRQVMINLVNNSIKFTESGKISVKVEQIDGARVLISVKDTGIGIPADKLEAVFQEFTQVDASPTRKVGGTGLGLPISRKLVEMHGGRLWAESTGVYGQGSTFFVELPFEARITEIMEKQAA
jgi:PAS domain S-box-containing protein